MLRTSLRFLLAGIALSCALRAAPSGSTPPLGGAAPAAAAPAAQHQEFV